MRFATYFLLFVLVGLTGPVFALANAKPQVGEIVLVVGPDPAAHHISVHEIGGRVLGPEYSRFGVFAISEEPGFAAALLAQGVWIVLDGRRMAALCGIEI